MRITAIETYIVGNPWKNWLFAKVSTDEGIHGIGEGTLNYFAKTVEAAIHELTPLSSAWIRSRSKPSPSASSATSIPKAAQVHMCAVSAIEIALWDIIGKACNQPIYNLMGGRCHEKLRAYANGWYRGPRTPENFRRRRRRSSRRAIPP